MNRTLLLRVSSLTFAIGVLLLGAGCPYPVVFIPDQALESAIRAELNKPFGCLTEEDLLQVTELIAPNLAIADLSGLEYCRSLTVLDLHNNYIRSIKPLANLKNLTWVDLGANRLTNIEALSGLFFIEYLNLYGQDNDILVWTPLVANAQAGGLGGGDVVVFGTEWTLDEENNLTPEFQEPYEILTNAGVDVRFAIEDGTLVNPDEEL